MSSSDVSASEPLPGVGNGTFELCVPGSCHNVSDPHPILREFVSKLNTYSWPILVILGTLCNCLAIAVFSGPYLRRLGVNVYLSALAASDTCYLFTVFIMWLAYVDVQVIHTNGWCQLVIFLSYTSSFLSAWFVVAVNVERYIAICLPLKREVMGSPRRARLVVLALSVSAALLFSCTLFINKVRTITDLAPTNQYFCLPLNTFAWLHTTVTIFDTIATMIVPFLSLLLLNFRIVWAISHHRSEWRTMSSMSHTSETSRNQVTAELEPEPEAMPRLLPSRGLMQNGAAEPQREFQMMTVNIAKQQPRKSDHEEELLPPSDRRVASHSKFDDSTYVTYPSHVSPGFRAAAKLHGQQMREPVTTIYTRAQFQVTKMMMWVTSVYLVLILPSYVLRVHIFVRDFLRTSSVPTVENRHQVEFLSQIQHICQLPFYVSFVINFFLYNFCNAKFRRALACMTKDCATRMCSVCDYFEQSCCSSE